MGVRDFLDGPKIQDAEFDRAMDDLEDAITRAMNLAKQKGNYKIIEHLEEAQRALERVWNA